ncbi:sensor histidine kinase [Cohnella suwonensis]|uniref:histidine kinase n=1 Tax=Cohnella suwonensis TaxID=696072 RepID=A0ABW0LXA8_9BACL
MERLENRLPLDAARIWRNPSTRRLAAALCLLFALCLAFAFWYSRYSAERVKSELLDKQAAAIGRMTAGHPDQTSEWLNLYLNGEQPTAEDISAGRKIMSQYGVTPEFAVEWIPAASSHRSRTFWTLSAAIATLFALSALLLFLHHRRQLSDIRDLALDIEETVKHDRPVPHRHYDEGELGLLASGAQELSLRLRQTIEQLHRDQSFLKDTVADISHQLKTPLASLAIYVDLLQEGNVDKNHADEFLAICRRELDRMEWLTLTLLKLARLEANALELNVVEASLLDTVEQAVEAVGQTANHKGVSIVFDANGRSEAGHDLVVPHDRRWLSEAIVNILKNAVEHSPPGASVSIGLESTAVFARLLVRDQGPGIDPEHLPHVFKKFYRAPGRGGEGSGVGLGLPLAKSIVEKHGGFLSAAPGESVGTTFTLALPQRLLPVAPAEISQTLKLTKL